MSEENICVRKIFWQEKLKFGDYMSFFCFLLSNCSERATKNLELSSEQYDWSSRNWELSS